jgi:azurin
MKMNCAHSLPAIVALLASVLSLTGCNSSTETAKSTLPPLEVVINANDKMKYDITTIEAKAGQEVKLTLKNVGTMPKQSMGHNWALLQLNTDAAKFVEAGFASASTDYVAPELASKVIAKTKILGPGESETITFTAPAIPSRYDFLCTFPGHFAAGMKGVLVVQ